MRASPRRPPFFATVRGTLVLLLLVVLLPVLLAQVGLSVSNYFARLSQEAQAQVDLARAIARTTESFVRDVQRTELAVGTTLTASPPPSPAEQTRLLTTVADDYPAILRINWLDPAGRALASSDPRAVGLDFGDRPYAQEVQAGQEMVLSNLFSARVDGQDVFTISRGIRDAQGNLLGIVVAVVDPKRLGELALTIERTGGAAIAIFDARGRLVYRRPEVPPDQIGQDWTSALPQLAQASAGQEVTGTFVSPVDGQERVFALAPIRVGGWVALADRSAAQVTAPLIRDLLVQLGLLLGIGGLGLAVALQGSRTITEPLYRVREHALAVGRGETPPPVAPSGPVELRDLASASNRMAAEIQAREQRITALYESERQARAAAEAAIQARDQFLAGSAHELKTPVTNLRGFAELALRRLEKEGPPAPEALRHTLETIDRQADRLARLVAQLLDVAAAEAGELEVARERTDLAALARDVAGRMQSATHRQLRVSAPQPVEAVVDRGRIEQALLNLLDNAAKYSPKDRPIELEVLAPEPATARIAVRDYGPGVPPERRELLFTRFYQAQAGRPFAGLGLGLYYARLVAELHGGHIEAEFPAGGGTRIVLSLPAAPVSASSGSGGER